MFKIENPSSDTQWRNLILFGKNAATYKFAFAKTLLKLVEQGKTVVTLDDLSKPYSGYMIDHLKSGLDQGNNGKFIIALKEFNSGVLGESEMLSITKSEGFKNVVTAFQNISGGSIDQKFYDGKYIGLKTQLTITDKLFHLRNSYQFDNLEQEVEARWRLVETAWNLNISANNLVVQYDDFDRQLFLQSDIMKRVDVSSARDALSGYQKGRCFYCKRNYSIKKKSENICHVDHFLPHLNKRDHMPSNINGVWNLVLACSTCNGAGEKGSKVPKIEYLNRLHERNQYYITSNHPLAETIINQTGITKDDRISFLNKHYQISFKTKSGLWKTDEFPEE